MYLFKLPKSTSFQAILMTICLSFSLTACKFDDPILDTGDKKDGKSEINTDKDVVEKDDETDTDDDTDTIDEKALTLIELADVWTELDFSKHKVRTQGYVSSASHYIEGKCAANLTFYPFENTQETLDVKSLNVRFEGIYESEEDCEDLKHKQVSLYIKNAIETDKDIKDIERLSAISETELIEEEDALEKFENFYTDLIEGQYPDIDVLDYDQFKETKDMQNRLLQTEIKMVKPSETACTLYFEETEESAHVMVSFDSKLEKNLSGEEITKENCMDKTLNKFLIADAHIDRKASEKQHFIHSYTFSEGKYEKSTTKDEDKKEDKEETENAES